MKTRNLSVVSDVLAICSFLSAHKGTISYVPLILAHKGIVRSYQIVILPQRLILGRGNEKGVSSQRYATYYM